MQKFYILDGSGYMYRAYHALPPLTDSDGHNLNAVFGFFRMIFKLLSDKPDYFIIARDAAKKTIRHEKFEAYKANRKETPDDLRHQIGLIKEISEKIGLVSFQNNGYEADDIIYTIVNAAKSEFMQIFIESFDKDLKQLIAENIFIRDSSKMLITGTPEFIQEFGFEPKCMIDYLALIGDASDNIPGIDGVGPKTATDLIIKYCSIDGIYDNIDSLSEAHRQKFIAQKEKLYKSRDLVCLIDVPDLHDFNLADYPIKMDFELFKRVLINEYGFKSFEKKIDELRKIYQGGNQLSLFG